MKKILIAFFLVLGFVVGCSSQSVRKEDKSQSIQVILDDSDRCLKEKSMRTEQKSDCYFEMYKVIESKLSDSDIEKGPLLKAVRRLYLLELQVENKQIDLKYVKAETMDITNDLRVELREAEYRSAVLNASAAQRQRQMFLAAQQMLTPPTTTTKTCTPQQGAPNGTFVCY